MKKLTFLFIFILLIASSNTFSQYKISDYEIKIKFKNLKDTVCFLGFHFGNNKYVRDTARVDNKGVAIFKGSKPLESGIYLIIIPSKNFFEFIFTEKYISIEADTTDFIDKMKVVSSAENKVFYDYLKFMKDKHIERYKFEENMKKHMSNKDSAAVISKNISLIDTQMKIYRDNIKKKQSKPVLYKSIESHG